MNSNKLHERKKLCASWTWKSMILWTKNPKSLLSEKLQNEELWKSLDCRIYTKVYLPMRDFVLSHINRCSLVLNQVCIVSFSFLLFWLSYVLNPVEKSFYRISSTENPAIDFTDLGVWSNESLRQTQINTLQLIFEFSVIKTIVIIALFQE